MDHVENIIKSDNFDFLGLHSHIGSQIFDIQPFVDLVDIMMDHVLEIQRRFDYVCPELNLGGGFGIQYLNQDDPPELNLFTNKILTALTDKCEQASYPMPKVIFEPGRSIVGNAGVTVYEVGAIKEIPNIKNYIFVDGGMADNPRPITYKSEYTFDVIQQNKDTSEMVYTIAGKYCESGDILAKDITLPLVKENDYIIVYGTGAYNYSMASNYNRCCRPCMVAVSETGSVNTLVRRETIDDLLRCDQF